MARRPGPASPQSAGLPQRPFRLPAGPRRQVRSYDDGRLVVCSHGFLKRTRKTPAAEIDRAQVACEAYRTAKRSGTLKVED